MELRGTGLRQYRQSSERNKRIESDLGESRNVAPDKIQIFASAQGHPSKTTKLKISQINNSLFQFFKLKRILTTRIFTLNEN